jgi:hypothetical protein
MVFMVRRSDCPIHSVYFVGVGRSSCRRTTNNESTAFVPTGDTATASQPDNGDRKPEGIGGGPWLHCMSVASGLCLSDVLGTSQKNQSPTACCFSVYATAIIPKNRMSRRIQPANYFRRRTAGRSQDVLKESW